MDASFYGVRYERDYVMMLEGFISDHYDGRAMRHVVLSHCLLDAVNDFSPLLFWSGICREGVM